jgi:hypothetical protein
MCQRLFHGIALQFLEQVPAACIFLQRPQISRYQLSALSSAFNAFFLIKKLHTQRMTEELDFFAAVSGHFRPSEFFGNSCEFAILRSCCFEVLGLLLLF